MTDLSEITVTKMQFYYNRRFYFRGKHISKIYSLFNATCLSLIKCLLHLQKHYSLSMEERHNNGCLIFYAFKLWRIFTYKEEIKAESTKMVIKIMPSGQVK